MKDSIIEDIRSELQKYVHKNDGTIYLERSGSSKEEKKSNQQEVFLEGAKEIYREKEVHKRNPALRARAIERYKFNCYVCDCNFKDKYGEYGAEYIEVHHLELLADTQGERESTVDDVRVVCSNCHSVLHRQGRIPMDIDKLRAFVRERKQTYRNKKKA
jgi:5-methylcytosine-specific restriction enzyme A